MLAHGGGGKARIVSQTRLAYYSTQATPFFISSNGDTYPLVIIACGLVDVVRRHDPIVVSEAFRIGTCYLVLQKAFAHQSNGGLKLGLVDVLSLPGFLAMN